jgi:hypothetical protein
MKRILLAAVGLASILTLAQPTVAQDLASSIVGTWKITGQMGKEVVSGKTDKNFGEQPVGHYIYTRGGNFVFFFVADNRKAPAGPNLTDAERIALFKTFDGGGGTYKVEGSKLVYRYDTSWHQAWTGTERTTQVDIAGKKLTLTTAPFKGSLTGLDVVVITTWERVE